VIAQRCDAKILTALLAVGDCIYFDFGTPECAWQRPSRSELPPVHWVSPVASRIRTEALLASSLLTIPLAQQSTLTASRLLRWTRSEHRSLLLVDDRDLLWRNAFGGRGRLRLRFRRPPPRPVPPVIRTSGRPPLAATSLRHTHGSTIGWTTPVLILSPAYVSATCTACPPVRALAFSAPQPAAALPLSAAGALAAHQRHELLRSTRAPSVKSSALAPLPRHCPGDSSRPR